MNYKKKLKWTFVGLFVVGLIMVTVYYTSVTRAENLEDDQSDSSLQSIVDFVKDIFNDLEVSDKENIALLNQNENKLDEIRVLLEEESKEIKLKSGKSLNRELLDICLAKAEGEWDQLQGHYENVLVQCLNIDLGLNGEKLFSNEECNNQIRPYKQRDRIKIRADKVSCFERYSERE